MLWHRMLLQDVTGTQLFIKLQPAQFKAVWGGRAGGGGAGGWHRGRKLIWGISCSSFHSKAMLVCIEFGGWAFDYRRAGVIKRYQTRPQGFIHLRQSGFAFKTLAQSKLFA